MDIRQRVIEDAAELGFADVGFTRPQAIAEAGRRLREWIAQGREGEMAYMADRLDWRADPSALWPEARSVIMLAENYAPEDDPLAQLERHDRAAISVYARNRDYHDLVKKKLKALGRRLIDHARTQKAQGAQGTPGDDIEIKVFVDTAPVMEKPLAAAAGLGWQGKHTNLVSRRLGSWFFLGAIFTTLDLAADPPHGDHCGACRRCLDICPTAAFTGPYQLDARRCISYLTIELKGPIPRAMRPLIGNRIYGCDDCLAVCPWNKFASRAEEARYWARDALAQPLLADLAALDETGFRSLFSGSPIKRIGWDRFMRNVAIAIGNAGEPALAPVLRRLIETGGPLGRGAAIWALSRLDRAAFQAARGALAASETDAMVREEWASAAADAEVA